LVKQIAEKSSYKAVTDNLAADSSDAPKIIGSLCLKDQIAGVIQQFLNFYTGSHMSVPIQNEAQLIGALAAYIHSADAALRVSVEAPIGVGNRRLFADLLIERDQEQLIIEVKRITNRHNRLFGLQERMALPQLESYLHAAGAKSGILLICDERQKGGYTSESVQLDGGNLEATVIRPGG
jgi:hypothetical protein